MRSCELQPDDASQCPRLSKRCCSMHAPVVNAKDARKCGICNAAEAARLPGKRVLTGHDDRTPEHNTRWCTCDTATMSTMATAQSRRVIFPSAAERSAPLPRTRTRQRIALGGGLAVAAVVAPAVAVTFFLGRRLLRRRRPTAKAARPTVSPHWSAQVSRLHAVDVWRCTCDVQGFSPCTARQSKLKRHQTLCDARVPVTMKFARR